MQVESLIYNSEAQSLQTLSNSNKIIELHNFSGI